MTLYRNRDIRKKRPLSSIMMWLVIAVLIYFFIEPLFTSQKTLLMATSSATAVLMGLNQLWLWAPARMRKANQYAIEAYRRQQGRLTHKEAAQLLVDGPSLPLASLAAGEEKRSSKLIGLPLSALEGHLLVPGPTRSGKGMHLTQVLLSADCAMLVVDPKGEQYERTAGYRATQVGPVYTIPGHTLDLARYFDLGKNDDLTELHYHLLKPWSDRQPIFAEKAKFLFAAAHSYAREHGLNPLLVLLDAAGSAPATVLEALRSSDWDNVMNFTNGDEPDNLDKFAASSWGNFATRMFDYQQHWHTLVTGEGLGAIPAEWAAQKATIYVTYPFDVLKGVGGAVSAIIAALMRYQKMRERRDQIIVAVDELPVVGLHNVAEYLATVGGYGISLILYVQTYSQLSRLYGERGAETILSNCQHQVWYPPADAITAKRMSEIYGTKLEPLQAHTHRREDKPLLPDLGLKSHGRSVSLSYRPALLPEEMMALGKNEVIVQADRQHVLRAFRLWPVGEFQALPPPPFEMEVTASRPRPRWGGGYRPPVAPQDVADETFVDPTG